MKFKLDALVKVFLFSAVIGVGISYWKIYFFHVVLFFLIVTFFYTRIANFKLKVEPPCTKFHYVFYFMFFWYLLSILWSLRVSYTLVFLFYIFCGLSIIFAMIFYMNSLARQEEIFRVLAAGFVIEIIVSLLEIFTKFRWPVSPFSFLTKYFGRDSLVLMYFRNHKHLNLDRLETVPTGFQWNPNNLAVVMLIIFPFFLFYPKWKVRLPGVISIIIIIFMTGSRGVLLSLIAVLVVYFSIYDLKKLLLFLGVGLICTFLLVTFVKTTRLEENKYVKKISQAYQAAHILLFETTDSLGSVGIRKRLTKNGIDALIDTKGLGVGGGASKAVQEMRGTVEGITSMHNFWIETLVEGGLVFFTVFVVWYVATLLKLFTISRTTNNTVMKYYADATLLSMIGFVPGAISASSVIYVLPMWLLYGFALVTINNNERLKNSVTVAF